MHEDDLTSPGAAPQLPPPPPHPKSAPTVSPLGAPMQSAETSCQALRAKYALGDTTDGRHAGPVFLHPYPLPAKLECFHAIQNAESVPMASWGAAHTKNSKPQGKTKTVGTSRALAGGLAFTVPLTSLQGRRRSSLLPPLRSDIHHLKHVAQRRGCASFPASASMTGTHKQPEGVKDRVNSVGSWFVDYTTALRDGR